jgi:hypothetical protein
MLFDFIAQRYIKPISLCFPESQLELLKKFKFVASRNYSTHEPFQNQKP